MSTRLLPVYAGLFFAVLATNVSAQRGGFGDRLNWGDDPPSPPAEDAPPNPPGPPPPAPTPPATPAPTPTPAADPEVVSQLASLRRSKAERASLTSKTIPPLTMEAAAEKARRYRGLVDRTLRQPYLFGVRPSRELVQRVKESHLRWGTLAGDIRAGKPPASLTAAALKDLRLPDLPPSAGDSAKMTGALWASLSNEYFKQTLAVEHLDANLAKEIRSSPKMRELTEAMDAAESQLETARKVSGQKEAWLRAVTWQLSRVWALGVDLQIMQLESKLHPDPDTAGLPEFLRDMDAARGLRHRGLSLSREGGASPPDKDVPATLVRAPAEGTIRASIAGAEASVDVAPAAANRLPQLAAELYHVHYLLIRAEEFEPGGAGARERIAARQRDYEGRRVQVVHEMTEEADRVLRGGQ